MFEKVFFIENNTVTVNQDNRFKTYHPTNASFERLSNVSYREGYYTRFLSHNGKLTIVLSKIK